jgi:hypothetical protein
LAEFEHLPRAGHETRDVPFRPLAIGLAILFVAVGGILGLAAWLYPESDAAVPLAQPRFPQPRLQPAPDVDYAQFHREQLQTLNSAGWTDASHQTVRVPIETAMRKLAQDGIPDWPTTPRREQ